MEAKRKRETANQVCENGKPPLCSFLGMGACDLGRPFANFVQKSVQWVSRFGNDATWLTHWPARILVFTMTLFSCKSG